MLHTQVAHADDSDFDFVHDDPSVLSPAGQHHNAVGFGQGQRFSRSKECDTPGLEAESRRADPDQTAQCLGADGRHIDAHVLACPGHFGR